MHDRTAVKCRFLETGTLIQVLLAMFAALLATSTASAQQNVQENQLRQFGAMQGFGIDSVDLTSLSVIFDVPVVKKPGRGKDLNLYLSYQGASIFSRYLGWKTPLQNLVGRGTQTTLGCSSGGCGYKFSWVDPFGVSHVWPSIGYNRGGWSCTSCVATDGSGLMLSPATSTITAPTGAKWNVIFGYNSDVFQPGGYAADSNGNQITETSTSVTDTLGQNHQVQNFSPLTNPTNITCSGGSCSGTPPPPEIYSYIDSSGTSRAVTINYELATVDSKPPASPCVQNYFGYFPDYGGLSNLPTSVTFPNGTAYTFSYEVSPNNSSQTTARVSRLTLPTGGAVAYTYPSAQSLVQSDQNCIDGGTFFLNRATTDGTWTFTRSLSNYGDGDCVAAGDCPSAPTLTTTVQDPKGNVTVYTFFLYIFGPSTDYTYILTSKAVYNGAQGGTPILYQQVCYNGFAPPCTNENQSNLPASGTSGRIIAAKDTYTSYNGGPSARTTTQYGWPLYVPVETDEYDFGASTPTRKTLTTYYTMNGLMSNHPSSIVVEDGSNNVIEQTQLHYDESAAAQTSGVTQHLAVSGQRGNLTSMLRWNSVTNTWLTTTYTNDDTGNRLSEADPKGNPPTQYSYSDSWYSNAAVCPPQSGQVTNAFLTRVIDSLSHQSIKAYDACSGLLRQERDPNDIANGRQGKTISFDEMNAAVSVNYSDGGGETTDYGNYAVPLTITTTKKVTSSLSTVSKTVMDGYGRKVTSILASDPSGADETDTAYDQDGLIYHVSNPYRSASDPTYGNSYFNYDALSRKTQEQAPDGTVQTWNYNGSTTTFRDENGNQWARTLDGLGRLIKVLEPNGSSASPSMETDYAYDILGNLLSVTQWGGARGSSGARIRNFSYDSLSRLIQAYNPESGWVCYGTTPSNAVPTGSNCSSGYDANGNLLYKTDARGVTIGYSYDALNRLTGKSYSAPNPPPVGYAATSPVSYTYDQDPSSYNPIDRRTGMTDGPGSQSWKYDSMGRITGINRTTVTPASTQSYGASYSYNFDGSLNVGSFFTGTNYQYSYDNAGRPTAVSSDNSGSYVPVASGATYDPAGHLVGLVQGGVTTTDVYNNRLQPGLLSAGTTSQAIFSHAFCYASCYSGAPTKNSGNILEDIDNVKSSNTATYSYDSLNRLVSAKTQATWGDSYTYDPFGNLYQMNPIGSGVGQSLQAQPTAQNQLSNVGLVYDAAGNVIKDNIGTQYSYDAEGRIATAGSWTYSYDGDGNRVLKTAGGSTGSTYWYGADGTLTDEQSVALNPTYGWPGELNRMFYLNGHLIQTGGFPANTIAGDYIVLYDQIGSTRVTVDINNGGVHNSDYYPFGGYISPPTDDIEQRFSGKERDQESGNDYFGARYYGSSIGRFLSADDGTDQDPTSPQSWNLYSYVRNNPLINTDPDGRDCVIQTRTDDHHETVTSQSGTCAGVHLRSGQSATYVNGTVTGWQASADHKSLEIGFTSKDGQSNGVQSTAGAPAFNNPGIDGPANAAVFGRIGNQGMGAIGVFAAGSVALGTAGGLGLAALPEAGLTTIGDVASPLLTNQEAAEAIGWGTHFEGEGLEATKELAANLTREDVTTMQSKGLTLGDAEKWRKLYQAAVNAGKGGEQAKARLALMNKIIRIMVGGR